MARLSIPLPLTWGFPGTVRCGTAGSPHQALLEELALEPRPPEHQRRCRVVPVRQTGGPSTQHRRPPGRTGRSHGKRDDDLQQRDGGNSAAIRVTVPAISAASSRCSTRPWAGTARTATEEAEDSPGHSGPWTLRKRAFGSGPWPAPAPKVVIGVLAELRTGRLPAGAQNGGARPGVHPGEVTRDDQCRNVIIVAPDAQPGTQSSPLAKAQGLIAGLIVLAGAAGVAHVSGAPAGGGTSARGAAGMTVGGAPRTASAVQRRRCPPPGPVRVGYLLCGGERRHLVSRPTYRRAVDSPARANPADPGQVGPAMTVRKSSGWWESWKPRPCMAPR